MDTIKIYIKEMIAKNANELNIVEKLIKIAIIFVVISILNKIINKIINKAIRTNKNFDILTNNKRATTLISIIKRTIYYFLVFIGVVMSLDLFNIQTKSILATAGIGGLAIGFGAQSLVKDIITGFFILLEDQYSIGELIQIEAYEGIVEDLGLRVTKLRSFSGELHIIPNGNITIVTNKTRGAMRALVTVSIGYKEDINQAIKVLEEVCENIKGSSDTLIEGPTVIGVANLGPYSVDINIVAKTSPMDQWAMEREIRKQAKEALEKAGIEIPYPKNVVLKEKQDKTSEIDQ